MKQYNKLINIFLCFLVLTGTRSLAQVTVTSSDSLSCSTTCTTLTAHLEGDAPTNSGITVDDQYPNHTNPIGFGFNFYGTTYPSCLIGPNGTICFDTSLVGSGVAWQINAQLAGNSTVFNSICGPWCDIDITNGGTITYSTTGIAPNRKFLVTFCATHMFGCTTQFTTTQMILYETSNLIEVHLAHKTICTTWNPSGGSNGGRAIIGVQNANGTASTAAPNRNWVPVWSATDEAWRFTPDPTYTSYTVTPIAYAPVPLASSNIYWYNTNTGAYLGTGTTIQVCPTVTTQYRAAALGCADSSSGYYTVTPSTAGPTVTLTTVAPSQCGVCDGKIVIHGMTPGLSDTIRYNYNSVPQTPVVAIVDASGNITLTGLCAGVYDNFIAKQQSCYSNPAGPVTITDPVITVTVVPHDPSRCGLSDGYLELTGLYASHTFSLTYTRNSVAQPLQVITSSTAGTYTITGLSAGTYNNITLAYGACATDPAGPYVLNNPPISMTVGAQQNPTNCGGSDGSFTLTGLYPNHAFTLNYSFNGVPQPPLNVTSSGTGSITVSGLSAGTYSNVVASFGDCATPAVGPIVLANPPISISSVTITNPSFCGLTDGNLVLHGLYPNQVFTINYSFNGVAQPPVIQTSTAGGTLTIPNLGAGSYTNIVASFGPCVTPAVGPEVLVNPNTIPLTVVAFTPPTQCGYTNGSIVIKSVTPYTTDTVNYSINGAPQPPYVTITQSDSSIHMLNLGVGNYTNLTVKIGDCIYTVNGSANLQTDSVHTPFDVTVHKGCNGDSVLFTNNSSSAGATLTYTWDFGDGSASSDTNPIHVYGAGTYTVTFTATNGSCTGTRQAVLTLGHPLDAAFTADPTILCQGQTATFTNTSVSSFASAPTYSWNFGDGDVSAAVSPSEAYPNVGTYNVTLVVTDSINCMDTAYGQIYVDTNSGVKLNVTDSVICQGTFMTFQGLYSAIGNTGVTFDFGDGDSSKNVNPVAHTYGAPGTYTVTVNALYRACRDISTSRNIIVYGQPTVNLGNDTSICPGSEPLLIGSNSTDNSGASYVWNTGETTPTIRVTTPGYYYLTASVNNCNSTDTIWVANDCYMSMPNVFSPNGDGVNEYFFPRQLLTRGLTAFSMNIYNRWGQLVFTTNSTEGRGWDGKFNGTNQPEGVYVYIIDATFKDGQKEHHQGNVTLIR